MKINNRIVKSTKIFTRCNVIFYDMRNKKQVKEIFDIPGRWKPSEIPEKRFSEFCAKSKLKFIQVISAEPIKKTAEMPEEDFFAKGEITNVEHL